MKPARFDYVRAEGLEHAVAALAQAGADAKVIAGGQSLVPMLNFRLLRPSVLVDINPIADLAHIEEREGAVRVGALVRHRRLETDPVIARCLPVLPAAMAHVAHLAIRNRGTIGGSLAHADPAAELPMLALLLDAQLTLTGAAATRRVAAGDFFLGALTTALAEDEVLTDVELSLLPPGAGWDFREVARRAGDFALVGVAAVVTVTGGVIGEARIALMGIGDAALRAAAAEDLLRGERLDDELAAAAAAAVRGAIDPPSDLHASADYRRHLAGVLVRRALAKAWTRAGGDRE